MGRALVENNLEAQRLKLEAKRIVNEHKAKMDELRIREKELDAALARAATDAASISAPRASVYAAVATLVGGLIGALINGFFTNKTGVDIEQEKALAAIQLEKVKFETGIILKGLGATDQPTAVKALKFFANAGLIPDYEQKVISLATENNGSSVPSLVENNANDMARFDPLGDSKQGLLRLVAQIKVHNLFACSGILLPHHLVLTASHCVNFSDANIYSVSFGKETATEFSVKNIKIKKEVGTALLEYNDNDKTGPVVDSYKFSFRNPVPGEQMYVLFRPGSINDIRMSYANCSVSDSQPADGAPLAALGFGDSGSRFYFTCPLIAGASGAPIFSRTDEIIGMVQGGGGKETDSMTGWAIHELGFGVKGGAIVSANAELADLNVGAPPSPP